MGHARAWRRGLALTPLALMLAAGAWFADRAFRPAPPLRLAPGGATADSGDDGGPIPELPSPPRTDMFYPLRRGEAFQAVFESALSRAEVEAFYAAAFAEEGFAPEGAPGRADRKRAAGPFADMRTYRRGRWRVDLQFFEPDAGADGVSGAPASGCEYRLAVMRAPSARGAERAAGDGGDGREREP